MTDLVGLGRPSPLLPTQRLAQPTLANIRHFLSTSAYSAATVAAYTAAAIRYHSHCPHQGRHSSASHLDDCLCEYICSLFHLYGGRNRQLAVNTVYGVYMLCPEVRDQLRASEHLLRGWQRVVPSISHRPLTWPIVVAIARTMAANGYTDCAVATLVAFDGLLRVGELVAINVADVSFPDDSRRGAASRSSRQSAGSSSHPTHRHPGSVYIRLAVTKTGANQTAEISNPDIIALLRHYVSIRVAAGAAGRLFHFPSSSPADHFRTVLRNMCCALDLESHGFTPHSLRHGGATHAHIHMGLSIEHVLHRGRWKSNSSARTYLQTGAAALLTTQLSEYAQYYVQGLQSHWYTALWADCFGGRA